MFVGILGAGPSMGAKASVPSSGGQSPRTRTFSSTSTEGGMVGGSNSSSAATAATGFNNLLRVLPSGLQVQQHNNHHSQSQADRQRARSLSSVPDLHNQQSNHHHNHHHPNGTSSSSTAGWSDQHPPPPGNSGGVGVGSRMELVSSSERHGIMNDVNGLAAAALGRVYTVTSSSHIWSLNGKFLLSFVFLYSKFFCILLSFYRFSSPVPTELKRVGVERGAGGRGSQFVVVCYTVPLKCRLKILCEFFLLSLGFLFSLFILIGILVSYSYRLNWRLVQLLLSNNKQGEQA